MLYDSHRKLRAAGELSAFNQFQRTPQTDYQQWPPNTVRAEKDVLGSQSTNCERNLSRSWEGDKNRPK